MQTAKAKVSLRLHMRGMNLIVCILRMFEDIFSLGAA